MHSPLRKGAAGQEVANLQTHLRKHGFNIPTPELALKLFGDATRRAVEDFQRKNRLPITGTLDELTQSALADGPGRQAMPTGPTKAARSPAFTTDGRPAS